MERLKRIGRAFLNSIIAIWRGEFLLRLRAERFLAHILYTFLLFGGIIWISLLIDTSMNRMEKQYARISELRLEQSLLRIDLTRAESRSAVARRLEELGSPLREPEQNATEVKR
ncbi:MAG: hypothetical protein IJS62_00750 [Bacteroidales bacterium]|nr:hypothetical protein [Bacteroidales bacterium]